MALRAAENIAEPKWPEKNDTIDHTYFDAFLESTKELDEVVRALLFDEFARGALASLRKNMSGKVSENKYKEVLSQITTVIDAISFPHMRDRFNAELVVHKFNGKSHIEKTELGPYAASVFAYGHNI